MEQEKLSKKGQQRRNLIVGGVSAAIISTKVRLEPKLSNAFGHRRQAAEELERYGITFFQKKAYTPGVSEALARGWSPLFYSGGSAAPLKEIREVVTSATIGAARNDNLLRLEKYKQMHREAQEQGYEGGIEETKRLLDEFTSSLDAWRMYLGLPQEHNTFGISEYKPQNSRDDRYYYRLKNFTAVAPLAFTSKHADRYSSMETRYPDTLPGRILSAIDARGKDGKLLVSNIILGRFTLSKGVDERGDAYISYYDQWDLGGSLEGERGIIGLPFEIYDRIYYNPNTFDIVAQR